MDLGFKRFTLGPGFRVSMFKVGRSKCMEVGIESV